MKIIWKKTDKHVYGTIFTEHQKDLIIFTSFSDPDGHSSLGNGRPQMLTVWGFENANYPLIKAIGTKEEGVQLEYDYEFFIAVIQNDPEDE